jgi:hypothetical protein
MQQAHGNAAISGVCSAGLASTALPAISAAAIWPVKMASGKFHGLIAGDDAARGTGRGLALGGVIAQEIHRLAQFAHGVGQGLSGLARQRAKIGRIRPHKDRRRGAGRRRVRRAGASQMAGIGDGAVATVAASASHMGDGSPVAGFAPAAGRRRRGTRSGRRHRERHGRAASIRASVGLVAQVESPSRVGAARQTDRRGVTRAGACAPAPRSGSRATTSGVTDSSTI